MAQNPKRLTHGQQFISGVVGLGVDPIPVPRLMLIHREGIQKELALTPEQKKKVALIAQHLSAPNELTKKMQADRLQRGQLTQQQLEDEGQAYNAARDAIVEDIDTQLLKTLTRRQRTRLEQLRLQAEGPLAFSRPEFLAQLNLDPGQSARIQEIVAQGIEIMMTTARVPLPASGNSNHPSAAVPNGLTESKEFEAAKAKCRDATRRVRAATTQAIVKILTKGQRATYGNMLGEPFDFVKMEPTRVRSSASDSQRGKPTQFP